VTRARKLIVQQVFTAANYEYAIAVSINPEKTKNVPTSNRRLSLVGISRKYDTVNHNWLPTGII
jgi:Cu2+-containing amine oxidase